MLQQDVQPIISVKETRKILGIKANALSDDEIVAITQGLAMVSKTLLGTEGEKYGRK